MNSEIQPDPPPIFDVTVLDEAPPVFPVKEKKRAKWLFLVLPLGLALLGAGLGIVGGSLQHAMTPVVYESKAQISIRVIPPRSLGDVDFKLPDPSEFPSNHDHLFCAPHQVEQCFERTKGLYRLRSFDNFPKEKIINEVIENLDAKFIDDDNTVLSLSYRGGSPEDLRTVLQNLVQAYIRSLAAQYDEERQEKVTALSEQGNKSHSRYRWLLDQRSQLVKDLSPGSHEELSKKLYDALTERQPKITELEVRLKQATDGLEQDEEAQKKLVWMLYQNGDLKAEPEGVDRPEPRDVLEQTVKMIRNDLHSLKQEQKRGIRDRLVHANALANNKKIDSDLKILEPDLAAAKAEVDAFKKVSRAIDPSGKMGRLSKEGYDVKRLQDATLGEKVWPQLPMILGCWTLAGGLSGLLLGLLLAVFIKL